MLLALVLFLLMACAVKAQENPEVPKIRAAYQEVTAAIAVCDATPDEPCGYYVNTMEVNRQNQPWAAVGIYNSVQDLWYQSRDGEKHPGYVLRKVNIETSRSNRKEHEEYFFDNTGNLLFYYFHLLSEGDNEQENRFYFADGKLVHYTEKIDEAELDYRQWDRSDATAVQKAGVKMQELLHNSL